MSFTADDRVKLTYHTDGFVQFSAENPGNIISGRDPKTGEPKGLGLFTHPLTTPIVSGPSVGITVWGIEDFDIAKQDENLIIFEPDDFYYRRCFPESVHSWHVGIYPFAKGAIPPLKFRGKDAVIDFVLNPISGGIGSVVVQMKVIYLESEKLYLGVYVERFITNFPSKSGWFINGPGNYTRFQSGYVLQAVYPREAIPTSNSASLDREPTA